MFHRRAVVVAEQVQKTVRHRGSPLVAHDLRLVRYLAHREWALTAEDVVWRRTKLGLRLSKAEIADVTTQMRHEPCVRLPNSGRRSEAGSVGGILLATYAGTILQLTHSYATLFVIAGSAYLTALVIILLLAPGLKKVELIA